MACGTHYYTHHHAHALCPKSRRPLMAVCTTASGPLLAATTATAATAQIQRRATAWVGTHKPHQCDSYCYGQTTGKEGSGYGCRPQTENGNINSPLWGRASGAGRGGAGRGGAGRRGADKRIGSLAAYISCCQQGAGAGAPLCIKTQHSEF